MKTAIYSLCSVFLFIVAISACGADVTINNDTPGDKEYYGLIEKGSAFEQKGDYENALAYYKKALKVDRFELPSYYVLLDIGRVQHKMGEYKSSNETLKEYLKHIEIEIKVESGEMLPPVDYPGYGYTEEGFKKLLSEKAEADALIAVNHQKSGLDL
jgi:tetratricopeptide (TPR) repeat protein